ncbi:unnamed protein product [Pleuronectes platessa]|uniref:Uncharacterized protein n=1 Tax=Pleuronectes platessa TaxID=8262 RepID=A0A9N7TVZ6_PLEPL|nr:unnamed protein product [Pleuronectes platessa]
MDRGRLVIVAPQPRHLLVLWGGCGARLGLHHGGSPAVWLLSTLFGTSSEPRVGPSSFLLRRRMSLSLPLLPPSSTGGNRLGGWAVVSRRPEIVQRRGGNVRGTDRLDVLTGAAVAEG